MSEVIACKQCKNACRLIMHGLLALSMYDKVERYNLWQCDECGAIYREYVEDVELENLLGKR